MKPCEPSTAGQPSSRDANSLGNTVARAQAVSLQSRPGPSGEAGPPCPAPAQRGHWAYLGGDGGSRAGHKAGDGLATAGSAGSRGRGRRGQPGGHHRQWQEAGPGTEATGRAATGPGRGIADAGGPMCPVGTPLATVPAHPVISFEAAVVPGHLGGPWLLLTGKQRPDLLAQSGEEVI